eukprot:UN00574
MTTKYYRLAYFNMAAKSSADGFGSLTNQMQSNQYLVQSLGSQQSKIQFFNLLFRSVATNNYIPDMAHISNERGDIGDYESVKNIVGDGPRFEARAATNSTKGSNMIGSSVNKLKIIKILRDATFWTTI